MAQREVEMGTLDSETPPLPPLPPEEEKKIRGRRARLVLSMAAADKYGLAFCLGAVFALRELGILEETRVVIGSGQACLLEAWLLQEIREVAGWKGLYTVPRHPGNINTVDPLKRVYRKLMAWCCTNQHWVIAKRRLSVFCCKLKWSQLMDPWLEELAIYLESLYALDEDWRSVTSSEGTECLQFRPAPVWLFALQPEGITGKSCYIYNKEQGINLPMYHIRLIAHKCVSHLSRVLTTSVTPRNRMTTISLDIQPEKYNHTSLVPKTASVAQHMPTQSGLGVDPLNVQAATLMFIKERLNVLPHGIQLEYEAELEDDETRSEKLLLLDAFTHSPVFYDEEQTSDAVRHDALTALADAVSAPDTKAERIVAYNKRTCTLYTGEPESRNRGYDLFIKDLYKLGKTQLTMADRDMVKLCVNAGYYRAYKAFRTDDSNPDPLLEVDDPYNLRKDMFPLSYPHGTIMANRLEVIVHRQVPTPKKKKRGRKNGYARLS